MESRAASKEESYWSIAAHVGPLAVALLSGGLLGLLVPLVIWLVKRDESSFIELHARESLNFQLTVIIIGIAALAFSFLTFGLGFVIAVPILLLLFIAELLFCIMAAISASNGQLYQYPISLRLFG